MSRYKSLRTRTTKLMVEDLRQRVALAYEHGRIARRRMELLFGILDTFEREAFLPVLYTQGERNKESQFDKGVDND